MQTRVGREAFTAVPVLDVLELALDGLPEEIAVPYDEVHLAAGVGSLIHALATAEPALRLFQRDIP
jgi:hypothetical protein